MFPVLRSANSWIEYSRKSRFKGFRISLRSIGTADLLSFAFRGWGPRLLPTGPKNSRRAFRRNWWGSVCPHFTHPSKRDSKSGSTGFWPMSARGQANPLSQKTHQQFDRHGTLSVGVSAVTSAYKMNAQRPTLNVQRRSQIR